MSSRASTATSATGSGARLRGAGVRVETIVIEVLLEKPAGRRGPWDDAGGRRRARRKWRTMLWPGRRLSADHWSPAAKRNRLHPDPTVARVAPPPWSYEPDSPGAS